MPPGIRPRPELSDVLPELPLLPLPVDGGLLVEPVDVPPPVLPPVEPVVVPPVPPLLLPLPVAGGLLVPLPAEPVDVPPPLVLPLEPVDDPVDAEPPVVLPVSVEPVAGLDPLSVVPVLVVGGVLPLLSEPLSDGVVSVLPEGAGVVDPVPSVLPPPEAGVPALPEGGFCCTVPPVASLPDAGCGDGTDPPGCCD